MVRTAALALTALTGASGLVYQVCWQKVLASLLGSHSEATAAVLALFLGGLSLGYAVFGNVSRRVVARGGSLLLTYGAVEASIGAFALLFPWLFGGIRALSLLLPHTMPAPGFAQDVALAALLVLPPAVLMGGTIPLLTQGLSRDVEDATHLHSGVYASNTAGAFVGALAAGFVLVPWLGLEVSIRAMGVVNVAAGAGFLALRRWEAPPAAREAPAPRTEPRSSAPLFGVVALLAGFAMMSLQTVANRIGALALGSSSFTFAMVVAIFVLCIALGSFGVAALPRIRSPWVAISQWTLVAILLGLYGPIENAGYWAHVVRLTVGVAAPVEVYDAAIFASWLAVALVPLALSGALLPLLFHHLREQVGDLGRVSGRLYAWNTAGSLLGALLGGYLLLFWTDLHVVYRLAVAALAVGAALLTPRVGLAARPLALAGLVAALAVLVAQPAWRPQRMAAGLFRSTLPAALFADGPDAYFRNPARYMRQEVLFHTDDPGTTVSVLQGTGRAIMVNGKSDGEIPGDNMTAGLAALLPALMARQVERAFVIGWGTGTSAAELVSLDSTREVVVAEISPGVMQAAPLFEGLHHPVLGDPKTRLVRGDAYRTLLRDDTKYDVIVSEPSHPWVTGIENLYSLEFLSAARERLSPGGVYSQWFHTYETDDEAVALVLATFRAAFDRVAVWRAVDTDLLILGFEDGDSEPDLAALRERFERRDLHAQLAALPVASFPRLIAHEDLPVGVLHAMELPDRVHTLMNPTLGYVAARAFYRKDRGELPPGLGRAAAEIGARNSLVGRFLARNPDVEDRLELMRETCALDGARCATLFALWSHQDPQSPVLAESLAKARAGGRLTRSLAPALIRGLAALYEADATAGDPPSFELARGLSRLYRRYYHHGAPFSAGSLHAAWQRCAQIDERCREGLERALQQGAAPPLLSRR